VDGGTSRFMSTMSFGSDKFPFTQSPLQVRTEAAIQHVKKEQGKIRSQQIAFETGLLDPEMVFRSIGFTNFLSTWLIRQVDPKKLHPNPLVEYVLYCFRDEVLLF
jgi:Ubiquitin elongating factor core